MKTTAYAQPLVPKSWETRVYVTGTARTAASGWRQLCCALCPFYRLLPKKRSASKHHFAATGAVA